MTPSRTASRKACLGATYETAALFTCTREHNDAPSRSPCRFFRMPSSVGELPRTPLRELLSPLPAPDCADGAAETLPELIISLPSSGLAPLSAEEATGMAVVGADGVLAVAAAAVAAAADAVGAVPLLPANNWSNEDPARLSKPGVRQLGRRSCGIKVGRLVSVLPKSKNN